MADLADSTILIEDPYPDIKARCRIVPTHVQGIGEHIPIQGGHKVGDSLRKVLGKDASIEAVRHNVIVDLDRPGLPNTAYPPDGLLLEGVGCGGVKEVYVPAESLKVRKRCVDIIGAY